MLSAAPSLRAALSRVLEDSGPAARHDPQLGDAADAGHQGNCRSRPGTASAPSGQRARYRVGEGVTGRVVESCKPVIVPQVSREPMFLNRASAARSGQAGHQLHLRPDRAQPQGGRRAVGATCPFKRDRDYDDLRQVSSVSWPSMVAQARARSSG